jgi:hypothetical protein
MQSAPAKYPRRQKNDVEIITKQKRFEYCLNHRNDHFDNYIFCDESTIQALEIPLYNVRFSSTHPNAIGNRTNMKMKVQVWSVISRRGSPGIFAFTNNLNGQGYFRILANHLIPFAKSYYGNDAILYQDNSAIHKEANCKALLISNNLNWERCPPYSPDMNPIEKLWADLKEFIANCRCQNDDQVLHAIGRFGELLTPEKCNNWIDHFVNQTIPRIISNRGDWSNS